MAPGFLPQFLTDILSANSPRAWAISAGVGTGTWVAIWVLKHIVLARLRVLSKRTETIFDDAVIDALGATRWYFYLTLAVWVGTRTLELPEILARSLGTVALVAALIQVGVWVQAGLKTGVREWRQIRPDDPGRATAASALGFVVRLALWSLIVLVVLSNLGIEISALIAGLGVGGIAAALAVQNVLGDLFSSLSIYFDRPFDIGDFVIVGDYMGTVNKVGLRSTRMTSLGGEQLIFANADLAGSRIRNYKRMAERRVVFHIGIEYGTLADKVERVPTLVREIIEQQDKARFDRSHFQTFGDFALIFESVYYVLSPDYTAFMDVQQAINMALFRRFEEEGLAFAFPTQTIHLEKPSAA